MKARFNNTIIAESDQTIIVEGNHYFPPDSVRKEYLRESDHQTRCPWKGMASYYHVEVEGERVSDGAWCYPTPSEKANGIKDYIAFWKEVEVSE